MLLLRRRGGEEGPPIPHAGLIAWHDPSDFATLFQDSSGLVPVTAAGQTVLRMEDKSGNDIHLTWLGAGVTRVAQVGNTHVYQKTGNTSAMRGLSNLAVLNGATQLVGCGAYMITAVNNELLTTVAYGSPNPSFGYQTYNGGERVYGNSTGHNFTGVAMLANTPSVITFIWDATKAAGARVRLRINGIEGSTTALGTATAAGNCTAFWIGGVGSGGGGLDGDHYGSVIYRGELNANQIAVLEQYYAAKAGVTL